jgi:ribose transport system substrate-binding protein
MMKFTRSAATVAAACTALTLSACGSGATGSSDDGSAEGNTVCYVTAASSHPYVTPANEAMEKAAEEAGVKQIVLSQEFDAQKGTDQLNTCIGRNVEGIVLWPLDPEAYIAGLAKAKAAGIPVVLINSPMSEEADQYIASFTGPDVVEEGKLSAQAMHEALGGKGDVVVIAGQAGNGTTEGRTQGFLDELEALGSDINVLESVNADFDQQKALVASRDLLTRFGDKIDGVYANDDTMARGFIKANKEAGNKIDPVIVGINGQKDAFASIKSGEMYATILQSPVADGKLAMETIVKAMEGETVEKRIPIDLTVVTKDNVDDIEPAM